jgi:uncharacterized protein
MAEKSRIIEIDTVRGFALFGVLLVNLTMMNAIPFSGSDTPMSAFQWGIALFAEGKFYTIFSLLFGLGFYMFMKNHQSEERFRRRLRGLLFFGILHLIFIWYGDILHVYAIAGFILMGSVRDDVSKLLKKSIGYFLVSTVIFSVFSYLAYQQGTVGPESAEMARAAYLGNSYVTMLFYRFTQEIPITLLNTLFILPKILSLFHMGFLFGKLELYKERGLKAHCFMKPFFVSAILFFISGAVVWASGHQMGAISAAVKTIFEEIGTVSGGLFYMTGLWMFISNPVVLKILSPLSAVGRMSLTNYLFQTLFWTTVLNGYGLGYFDRIPERAYLPLALLFFALQGAFSILWLRRFKFGPVERIWRYMTYGRKGIEGQGGL